MEACAHPERKHHARLRHRPGAKTLWVGDPEDWALVRQKPRPPLVCPEPGCNVELISYENLHNQYNPRIFKFKHVGSSCNHWTPEFRGGGGGPPSPEHVWMQLYLTRIVTSLWYTATPEHPPTRADVFVHECSYCLEVQLRPTQFRKRTQQRAARGARVCWFIREGLDTEKARKALFGLPAVRFRVVDESDRLLAPWNEPDNQKITGRARLQVFGTIAHLEKSRTGELPFRTRTMDGISF